MLQPQGWHRLRALLRNEVTQLLAFQRSERHWLMPLCSALASGLPLLIGAHFNHLGYGLVSSLGGLVFLYLPNTPLQHRMLWLMACAFGMAGCYALGLMSHFQTPLLVIVLTLIATLVTMVVRIYGLGPPGSLFFVMAASIGAYSHVDVMQVPLMVGLLTMGGVLACLIAFVYSLCIIRIQPAQPMGPLPTPTFDFVIFDSIMIGLFVGLSLTVAHALQLQRPYWVPVSCLAVIQGVSMRAVWNKQLQRITGTGIGLILAWGLLSLPLGPWSAAFTVMALNFIVETLVVRHYGLAVIFITPLTILLAEASTLGQNSPATLMQARFWDTVVGSLVGLIGGVCLHNPRFRGVVGKQIRRLIPHL